MKKIILFIAAIAISFAAQAQETYKVLKINKGTDVIYEIPLAEFDSITFETRKVVTEHNGHEYVDLGLPSGTLWATCNVGATNPEDYGNYFAWGETTPKSQYNWSTYKHCNGSYSTMTKYCNSSRYGTVDNKKNLEATDDAATANWGGEWRMPTLEEQKELLTECTWTDFTFNGVNGYRVTGKNGNSIFLPAAGYYSKNESINTGEYGFYWSSSLYLSDSSYAYYLCFITQLFSDWRCHDRYCGRSVRPVCSPQ